MDIKNLLSVHKISKSYGIKTLYKDITFGIHEGEKVAIVAKNGAGKTTLMRTLMDPATADTGEVVFRNGVKLRYLEQQPNFEKGLTVRQVLYNSEHAGLEALRHYEKVIESGGDGDAMQRALDQVEATDGWNVEGRIQEMHGKMNLPDMDRVIDSFSGGEVKRLALAPVSYTHLTLPTILRV